MIRADLVSNRIKPGLFRDVTLGNFFRKKKKKKGIKWLHSLKKLLLVRKGSDWASEAQRMSEEVSIPAAM